MPDTDVIHVYQAKRVFTECRIIKPNTHGAIKLETLDVKPESIIQIGKHIANWGDPLALKF